MAATANVFALLGGDGDDDIQQLAEKAAPLIKEKAAPAPAPAATKPEPRADAGRGGRGGAGRGDRGGRGGRGGRGPREAPLANGVEDPVSEERGEGGRGRGYGGRGRGGRGRGAGGYDGARPPRREYERRDGTGRGHEVQKRGGAGVGNWGTAADDSKEPAPAEETKVEGTEEVPAEPPAESPEAPAEPQPEPEPEVKEMTLEEYEKQLAEKRAALNKVAEVKAVSQEDFKGMKAYVRKEAEETIPGLELSKRKDKAAKADEPKEKPKKQVNTIETGFRLPEPEAGGRGRGRGPRGGRGEGRGGDRPDRPFSAGRGGRGEGRGREGGRGQGRGGGRELPIHDASAFPSLG